MMNIKTTVRVAELIDKVQANRDNHRGEYEKAWTVYEKVMREWFEEQLKRLQKGKKFDRIAPHPVPEDHTDDYDQLLGMLRMNTNELLELDWSMYQQFVEDEWGWSRSAGATNTYYASMS
jgi:hypothetical protein